MEIVKGMVSDTQASVEELDTLLDKIGAEDGLEDDEPYIDAIADAFINLREAH